MDTNLPKVIAAGWIDDSQTGPGFRHAGLSMSHVRNQTGIVNVNFDAELPADTYVVASSMGLAGGVGRLADVFVRSVTNKTIRFESYDQGQPCNTSFYFLVVASR